MVTIEVGKMRGKKHHSSRRVKTETPGVWPVRYDERTFPP